MLTTLASKSEPARRSQSNSWSSCLPLLGCMYVQRWEGDRVFFLIWKQFTLTILTMTSLHSPQHSTSEQNSISNICDHILSAALLTGEIFTCIWITSSPKRSISKIRVPRYKNISVPMLHILQIRNKWVCNLQMSSMEQITDSSHISEGKYKIHELCLWLTNYKLLRTFMLIRHFAAICQISPLLCETHMQKRITNFRVL